MTNKRPNQTLFLKILKEGYAIGYEKARTDAFSIFGAKELARAYAKGYLMGYIESIAEGYIGICQEYGRSKEQIYASLVDRYGFYPTEANTYIEQFYRKE